MLTPTEIEKISSIVESLRGLIEKPAEKWPKERAAFERGEIIQIRYKWKHGEGWSGWEDLLAGRMPAWIEDEGVEYRIKPEPVWKPRFKVGDRVRIVKEDKYGSITKILESIRGYKILERYAPVFDDELEPIPKSARVALEASDIPPGSAIRHKDWREGDYIMSNVVRSGVCGWVNGNINVTFANLMERGWQILRPGKTDWEPCSKAAHP